LARDKIHRVAARVGYETSSKEFCELLNSHGVEYVIVGRQALAFHGAPRFTGDIDFLKGPGGYRGYRDG
jgi:hypothetical protein